MTWLAATMGLDPVATVFAIVAVFAAGVVRGFSGFALSALCMATLVFVIDPVEILPICLVLELTATFIMVRGGLKEADKRMVLGLISGAFIGLPLGLLVTTLAPVEVSRLVALSLILVLAIAQLSGYRPAFLATRSGLMGSGVAAGVVQGAAASGGMVIALYTLARSAPASVMRASLVVYLMLSVVTNTIFYTAFGVLTAEAMTRGLLLAAPCAIGVVIGARLFSPRFQPYYRPACLTLLTGLAAVGLVRTVL